MQETRAYRGQGERPQHITERRRVDTRDAPLGMQVSSQTSGLRVRVHHEDLQCAACSATKEFGDEPHLC